MLKTFFRSNDKKSERGQALVEFALLAPILVLLVLGIIQFGIIFYGQVTITAAAREGARMASVGKPDTDIESKILLDIESTPFLSVDDDENRQITISERNPGQEVRVDVPANVDIIIPFLSRQGSRTYPIAAKSSMRYQITF